MRLSWMIQIENRLTIPCPHRQAGECLWKIWWRKFTQSPDSIQRWYLTSISNPIVEIRWSYDHLISTMGFPMLVRRHLYIESGPWYNNAIALYVKPLWCWNQNTPEVTRSIPFLLMTWLLVLTGHQQTWCWICKINVFLTEGFYLSASF